MSQKERIFRCLKNIFVVVILNSRGRRRMGHLQLIKFVKEAVKNLVYNISLTTAATDQLDSWEEGNTSTPVMEG